MKSQRETFKTIKPNEIKQIGIDIAEFGSDEIWNIKRIKTGKLRSAFWGDGIRGIKKYLTHRQLMQQQ